MLLYLVNCSVIDKGFMQMSYELFMLTVKPRVSHISDESVVNHGLGLDLTCVIPNTVRFSKFVV